MQYRTFGKLGWQPSALGFGCMRLPIIGDDSAKIDQDQTTQMIHTAIDAGVNYFDTAYVYHGGNSEVALGIGLQGGLRDKVRIATKLPVFNVKDTGDFDRMLDEQLVRLQTDTIDFYLLHSLDAFKWQKVLDLGLLKEAEDALADGRIQHLGFSFHDSLPVFKTIVDDYNHWDFCQIQYNFIDVEYQAGLTGLKYAAEKGLAVVIMEPLRGGKLASEIPAAQALWDTSPVKRSPVDWALQWLWSQPEVSLVLSGMSNLQQVKDNIVSAANSQVGLLNQAENALVDQVRQTMLGLAPVDCTRCEYCLPCPQGVNIPRVFDYYNRVAVYNDLEGTREGYRTFVDDEQKASNCIQCEECLPKCPQNLPISDWMPVIDGVFMNGQPFRMTPD